MKFLLLVTPLQSRLSIVFLCPSGCHRMLFVGGDLESSSELASPLKHSCVHSQIRAVSSSAGSLSKAGNTAGSWGTLSSV